MELRFFKIKKPVEGEIQSIYQMLLDGNSFKSFCANNEVYDICKHKVIKKRNRLFQLYANDTGINSVIVILNKN